MQVIKKLFDNYNINFIKWRNDKVKNYKVTFEKWQNEKITITIPKCKDANIQNW